MTAGSPNLQHLSEPPRKQQNPLLNRGSMTQAAFIIFDVFVSKFAGIRVYSGFQQILLEHTTGVEASGGCFRI